MSHVTQPRAIHWIGSLLLGIIWGATFMGVSLALRAFSPEWVAAGRLVIGTATLAAIIILLGDRLGARAYGPMPWKYVILIGMLSGAAPYLLLSWGLQFVPSSFAGVSMAAVALFILPLAHFFVPGETMTRAKALGVATGFAGVVVLLGAQNLTGGAEGVFGGRLACLAVAGCYATSSILTRLCPPVEPVRLTCFSLAIGAIPVVPIALWTSGVPSEWPVLPVAALVLLGVVPTGVAILVRVLMIRSAGPGFTSLTAYQIPVWAVIFGVIFLSEPVPPQMLLALVLILGGIAVSQANMLGSIFRAAVSRD